MEISQPRPSGAAVDQGLEDRVAIEARRDKAAFTWLYEQHVERVFRYLRGRGANEDEATELTAVTFERAFRHVDRYRPGQAGFAPWLLAIARNAFIDERRRRRPQPLAEAETLVASGSDPEEAAIAAEDHRRLAALVARLPDVQRDALALRFAAGLSSRDIGAVIGKSEAATKKLLTRTIAALKEDLNRGA